MTPTMLDEVGRREAAGVRERAWIVAPALLVCVAAVQFLAVIRHDLSTWSGAGMGMFASIDNEQTRYVSLTVELEGHRYGVPNSILGDRRFELQVLPAKDDLRSVAEDLLSQTYRIDGDAAEPTADGIAPTAATAAVIGIALHGTPEHPELRSETVREVTLRP